MARKAHRLLIILRRLIIGSGVGVLLLALVVVYTKYAPTHWPGGEKLNHEFVSWRRFQPGLRDIWSKNLERSNLSNAKFQNVSFAACNLRWADLRGADLRDAWFISLLNGYGGRSMWVETDLRGADFSGADIRGANLNSALLEASKFEGALYDEKTKWPVGFDPTKEGAKMQPGGAM